jgi:hypothetical protein
LIQEKDNKQDVPDFEAHAQQYLDQIQMQIDPHKFIPCDPAGKFSDECVVIFDDGNYEEAEIDNVM